MSSVFIYFPFILRTVGIAGDEMACKTWHERFWLNVLQEECDFYCIESSNLDGS